MRTPLTVILMAVASSLLVETPKANAAKFGEGFANQLCTALVPTSWKDTIQAPKEWKPQDCREFARRSNATHFQIGCEFAYGSEKIKFAEAVRVDSSAPIPIPVRECGWRPEKPKVGILD